MAIRATMLLTALALGGCFKLEYKGDILFACEPGEPADSRCPGGYACATPIAGQEAHRCHRLCDPQKQDDCPPDLECLQLGLDGEHVCAPRPNPPEKDAGPDGKVQPSDGPAPVASCTGHYVVGSLANDVDVPFDLVAETDDSVVAVWIDEGYHLQVKPRKGASWLGQTPHDMAEPIDRVAATGSNDSGLLLVFRPKSDHSVVKHCVLSQASPGVCSVADLLNDQSVDLLDLDLARGPAGTMLAVAQVVSGSPPTAQFYDVKLNPTTKLFEATSVCTHNPQNDLELPRVAVGESAWVGSVWQRNAAGVNEWRFFTASDATGTKGCKDTGISYNATSVATPANLAVGGRRAHTVFEEHPVPGHPQHAVWDDIEHPPASPPPLTPIAQKVVPGSSHIALVGDAPCISAVPEPPGPLNGRNPARVWRSRPTAGFQQLPSPTPDEPDNAPFPAGKKSGTWSRVAAAHDGKRVHVLYDAFYGPNDKHVLVYYQCDLGSDK
jgi:hypothetical protein